MYLLSDDYNFMAIHSLFWKLFPIYHMLFPTCSHSFTSCFEMPILLIFTVFHFLILRIKLRIREQFSNWQDKLKCVMLTNPFASLQKSHYLNFAGPGNYLSALCLVLLFFIHLFGLSDRVHFTFGTIFKDVSYTWVSPKEWHCCR